MQRLARGSALPRAPRHRMNQQPEWIMTKKIRALSTAFAVAVGTLSMAPATAHQQDDESGAEGGRAAGHEMMGDQGMMAGPGMMGGHGMMGGSGMVGGRGMTAGCRMMAGPRGIGPYMAGVLELTDEQREQLDAVQRRNAREHWQLRQQMREHRATMAALWRENAPDPDTVGDAHRRMSETGRRMLELRARMQGEVHDILTAEQRDRLREMRRFHDSVDRD